MTMYQYTAINRMGEKIAGEIEAEDKHTVLDLLDKQGLLPVEVTDTVPSTPVNNTLPFIGKRPSPVLITLFTRELAMLLNAGLPLDKAMFILLNESKSDKLQNLIRPVLKSINDGKSFHAALKEMGPIFPPVYTSMIQVAEESGTLNIVLERLAETREKEQKLKAKALSTILYPSFLVVTAIAAIIIMLVYVVPGFKDLIQNANGEVPDSSKLVIAASDWLIENGILAVQLLSLSVLMLLALFRKQAFKQAVDNILFRVPVIGSLKRLGLTIQFCRTMGTLLENGVDLPQAMNLTKNVLGNVTAQKAVAEAGNELRKGQDFLGPLSKANIFPTVVLNMLRVGEETGDLAKSSNFLANMYEEKLETSVQRIFSIMEPLIIMIVSLFVAGIIISIIGSVLSINDLAT